ncbi:hypothetical protein QWZ14_12115, partial [Paeniroseomonas aquatica]|nr:hypothetical protein [Paeniroseomonas aquatica]
MSVAGADHLVLAAAHDWPRALRVYLGVIAIGNLAWEAAHLPLYALWNTGTAREKLFAIVHCTVSVVALAHCGA